MKKLIIIDGPSVLMSCFFGQAPKEYARAKSEEERKPYLQKLLKTSDGTYINGVYGMTKYLLKLIRTVNPSHLVVSWDTTRDTFRRLIYPEYKGNRSVTPKEIHSQIALMQSVIEELGIYQIKNDICTPYLEEDRLTSKEELKEIIQDIIQNTLSNVDYTKYEDLLLNKIEELDEKNLMYNETIKTILMNVNFESDDFIGTLSAKFGQEINTSIITKDRDMLQLVDDRTTVWLITSKTEELNTKYSITNPTNMSGTFSYNPYFVEQEYFVSPNKIVDLKALIGDTSDNIPGVKNCGESSAPQLVMEYGTIENLYDNIRHLDGTDKETKAELKELKEFWKNDLGIKRNPINALIKKSDDENEIVGEKAAMISKQLGKIKTDINVNCSLDDFKFTFDLNKFIEQAKKYEFYSLISDDKTSQQQSIESQQQSLF